jgi:hypothetical protein
LRRGCPAARLDPAEARARAGVAIADLTIVRDQEQVAVEVTWTSAAAPNASTTTRCARGPRAWATGECGLTARSGARARPGGEAHTLHDVGDEDADASFWQFVRHRGAFLTACVRGRLYRNGRWCAAKVTSLPRRCEGPGHHRDKVIRWDAAA